MAAIDTHDIMLDADLMCLSDDESTSTLAPFQGAVSIALEEDADQSNWCQVMAFMRNVDRFHPSAAPDFTCVHTADRMFDLRNYRVCLKSDLVDDFESWREIYNHCSFAPFLDVHKNYVPGRAKFLDVLHKGIDSDYFCMHSDPNRYVYNRCRTRPVCCDEGHRSFCWLDINISFHRAFRTNAMMPICVDAPIKSFRVDHPVDHPMFRIKKYLHCGSSDGSSESIRAAIDSRACKEIETGANLLRMLIFYPELWSHAFEYLNVNERMVFVSMMFENDDDPLHDMRCMRMYGFNASRDRYSLFHGHNEMPMDDLDSLQKAMHLRRLSPCQQLMKYAGEYDIMNTVNRHAVRHNTLHDWESIFHRLTHSIGKEMRMDVQRSAVIPGVETFMTHEHQILHHTKCHTTCFEGMSDLHRFAMMVKNNPSPLEFLSLFDYFVRKNNKDFSIARGNTLADIFANILEDDCPTHFDLRRFLDGFDWDFSTWDGLHAPSSVAIFLFQVFNCTVIDMAYLEFMAMDTVCEELAASPLCKCDAGLVELTAKRVDEVLSFCLGNGN